MSSSTNASLREHRCENSAAIPWSFFKATFSLVVAFAFELTEMNASIQTLQIQYLQQER